MGGLAILVAVESGKDHAETTIEYLNELAFLAETSGIKTIEKFIQKLPHADPRTYVGKGKFAEIKDFVFSNEVDNVIFDDDLSPSQLRNIENELNPKSREYKVQVYDRSLLILNIFTQRAQTAQARAQVELAISSVDNAAPQARIEGASAGELFESAAAAASA